MTREFDIDDEQATAALDYYDAHPELVETLRPQREARSRTLDEQSLAEE